MKENKYSILSDHQKETIQWVFRNAIESIYAFFGRRIKGSLIDDILKNTKYVRNILIKTPHFEDSFRVLIGPIEYKIDVLFDMTDKYQYAPTVRINKLTNKYTVQTVESILDIAYISENKATVEFLNNCPVIIRDIYTRKQLRTWFGWGQRELDQFYVKFNQYLVKIV